MSDFALSWAALGRLDEDADGEEPEAEEDADGEEAESEVDEDAGGADDPDDEDDPDGDEDEDADGDEDEEDDDAEGEEDAEGVEDEVPDGGEDLVDEEADGLGSPGPEPTRSLPDSVQAAAAIVTSARAPNPVSNTFMTICSFFGSKNAAVDSGTRESNADARRTTLSGARRCRIVAAVMEAGLA